MTVTVKLNNLNEIKSGDEVFSQMLKNGGYVYSKNWRIIEIDWPICGKIVKRACDAFGDLVIYKDHDLVSMSCERALNVYIASLGNSSDRGRMLAFTESFINNIANALVNKVVVSKTSGETWHAGKGLNLLEWVEKQGVGSHFEIADEEVHYEEIRESIESSVLTGGDHDFYMDVLSTEKGAH